MRLYGAMLGVARNTISEWLDENSVASDKAFKVDNRVRVPREPAAGCG